MRRIFITLSLTLCHSLSTLSHNFWAYGYPQCVIGINTNAKFVIIKRKYVTVFEHNICMQRFVTLCWANTWEDVIYTWQLVANWKKCIIGFKFHPSMIDSILNSPLQNVWMGEKIRLVWVCLCLRFENNINIHSKFIGYSNSFGK